MKGEVNPCFLDLLSTELFLEKGGLDGDPEHTVRLKIMVYAGIDLRIKLFTESESYHRTALDTTEYSNVTLSGMCMVLGSRTMQQRRFVDST